MADAREYTGPNAMLAEIERLTKERDEWKAAADTEARLRREFHDKAECLTAEVERLRASQDRLKSAIEFAHAEGFQWPSDPMQEFDLNQQNGLPPLGPDLSPEQIASLQERALAPQSQERDLYQQTTNTTDDKTNG